MSQINDEINKNKLFTDEVKRRRVNTNLFPSVAAGGYVHLLFTVYGPDVATVSMVTVSRP